MVAGPHAPVRNRSLEWLIDGGDAVVVDVVHGDVDPAPSLDDELARFVAAASDARRRDFAFGRRCASLALEAAGSNVTLVGRHDDRSPAWPDGWIGSISHTQGYAIAVVTPESSGRAVGIDAEHVGAVDDDVADAVLTPNERTALDVTPGPSAATVFAAKEAFFKAQYPLTQRWVDFTDVEFVAHATVDERSGVLTLQARIGTGVHDEIDWPVEARWTLIDDIVVVGVSATQAVADR